MKQHRFALSILGISLAVGIILAASAGWIGSWVGWLPSSTAAEAANLYPPSSALSETPVDSASLAYNPVVAGMINAVQQNDVYNYAGALSGEFPVTISGQAHTIATRNMYYPAQLAAATQYAYEFMQAQGLSVSFFEYEDINNGRNVVAELPGTKPSAGIVLVTAHIDNMPESSRAPGADDNASGSVGVMMTAKRLAGHSFERTVRFVLFTDEEYEMSGSASYAQHCYAKGENIVAVYNMDMIAWDDNRDGHVYLETRVNRDPGYSADQAIANTFIDVVNTYGLKGALVPKIDPNGDDEVDSISFWELGYPSITVIEDFDYLELNPYYHTKQDILQTLNLSYFTNNVKATVGTIAHLAVPTTIILGKNKAYLPLLSK